MCVNFDLVMFCIYLCAAYELEMEKERNWSGLMGMAREWE